jgi:dipeptidyl-peptidase-4
MGGLFVDINFQLAFMKKIFWLLITVLIFSSLVLAQDKLITLDDIFSPDPNVRVKFGGTPVFVQWAADGRSFRQVVNGELMRVDAISGQAEPYYDDASLAAALMHVGVKTQDARSIANSASLQFSKDESAILLNQDKDLWLYQMATKQLTRLTNNREEEKEEGFSPDSHYVSFVRGNNLFVVDAKGSEKQLTRDGREGDKAIYNGYLDWVYEEELYGRGQKRGYWWSPDSKYIAFLRLDESPVPKFVIPNDIPTDQEVETTFYPQAGDPNPLVRLGIANVGKTALVPNAGRIPKIGEKLPTSLIRVGDVVTFADTSVYKPDDLLIVRVAWSPDSRAVVFQAQNREQTMLDLNAAATNGKVTKLFTENSPAWVGVNDNPFFLKNGSAIWESECDGWNHLYLYGNDGELIRRLTTGKWEVRTVYGLDPANEWVYFTATKDNPIGEHLSPSDSGRRDGAVVAGPWGPFAVIQLDLHAFCRYVERRQHTFEDKALSRGRLAGARDKREPRRYARQIQARICRTDAGQDA